LAGQIASDEGEGEMNDLEPESAGRVPAFWKRDKGPGELIVVGCFRWRIYDPQMGQKSSWEGVLDRHSDGLQPHAVGGSMSGARGVRWGASSILDLSSTAFLE
jgi:hypothetical protein